MSNVLISTESRYPINRDLFKKTVEDFLVEQKIKSEIEVSISIVGDRKMRDLNNLYRKIDKTTPVLTFSQSEGVSEPGSLVLREPGKSNYFVNPPDNILRIGDIVISYPQAVLMAAEENKMVDHVLSELVNHGLSNLFGLNKN